MGIEERINIYATMLWVAVLAIGLLRAQKARSYPKAPEGSRAESGTPTGVGPVLCGLPRTPYAGNPVSEKTTSEPV
jgi:hypothetical protein